MLSGWMGVSPKLLVEVTFLMTFCSVNPVKFGDGHNMEAVEQAGECLFAQTCYIESTPDTVDRLRNDKQTNTNLRCGKGLLGRNDQTHHRIGPKTMDPHHQSIGVPKQTSNYGEFKQCA